MVGTPEYMSPEQLAGDKLDGRSDIYSLALVAFNMLTGTLPFPSDSAQEAMIMRLTDQPQTLAEMKPDVAWPVRCRRSWTGRSQREGGGPVSARDGFLVGSDAGGDGDAAGRDGGGRGGGTGGGGGQRVNAVDGGAERGGHWDAGAVNA